MSAAQTAVVTGGGNGLGAAIVRRLHADGNHVAIADLDAAAATALAADLDDTGTTARSYAVDVGDRDELAELPRRVLADFGEIHVLVNNAARTQAVPLLEITPHELDEVMRINFHATFHACQLFGTHFARQGYGRIVNMASLAAQNGGTATGGHYASSKGAITSATKAFARELAPHGVTVNAVSPGPLDGPTVRSIVGPDRMEDYLRTIPVGRLGDPDFIARMVALLAAPEAASVTGACWDANGGLYLR